MDVAQAITLGGFDHDNQYRDAREQDGHNGVLSIIAYNLSSNNISSATIFSAPKYEIHINNIVVAKVSQRSWDIATQSGKFNYFSTPLPSGKYKVSLIQSTIFNSGRKSEFDVIVREGKEISVTVVNDIPEVVTNIPSWLGGLETIQAADFYKENLVGLAKLMLNESAEFHQREKLIAEQKREKARLEALEMDRYLEQVRLDLEEKEKKKKEMERQKFEDELKKQQEIELVKQKEKDRASQILVEFNAAEARRLERLESETKSKAGKAGAIARWNTQTA